MKRSRIIDRTWPAGCLLAGCLLTGSALAQLPKPPACPHDDVISSMGAFIVWVAEPYRSVVAAEYTNAGWNRPEPNHWTSLVLVDQQTVIGHSCVHLDGDATDTGGAIVGTAGTSVKDSDFDLVPTADFTAGPTGSREVHTEIVRLWADDPTCRVRLRAGVQAGVERRTLGEMEDKDPAAGGDFPAESFFVVYFEVDVPFYGGTILYTPEPVLLVAGDVNHFPPQTIYYHGETEAVAVHFKDGPEEGNLFGYLRLAGHGAQFQCQDPFGGVLFPDCPDRPRDPCDFECDDRYTLFTDMAEKPLVGCNECNPPIVPLWWILTAIIVVLLIVIIVLLIRR
ncbi:MAG: hypothetical protein GY856_14815 [bacterium]|nr:hypothetical protein [bacterium]